MDRGGELSYAELGRRVRGLAAGLAARGVRPGSVVGVKVPADRRARWWIWRWRRWARWCCRARQGTGGGTCWRCGGRRGWTRW
ncbi:hypothetical protein [Kitasatospora fiedleri]|uniref:hypothetical protein n=1 Tax=Kitasatospora fiedleri TaxID=2991545 RepID=UPI002499DD74|nr:hypothetical protein [Kitasatospora fiedleri]